jgi:hypothetical protein
VFCVGFVDEGGRDVGATASPPMNVNGGRGVVRCSIEQGRLRPGIYFPVAAILAPDGRVEDRWRLDRAVVVEEGDDGLTLEEFGPVEIPARWTPD